MTIDLEHAIDLYETWWGDLRTARRAMQRLHAQRCVAWSQRSLVHRVAARALEPVMSGLRKEAPMLAQVDDEVCELLYMLLRSRRPQVVVEISPFHGWSTSWILTALQHNGTGQLRSFDVLDSASRNVPAELKPRWELVLGDVRKNTARIPQQIDFLLMDSDHSAEFAQWYLDEVFPRVRPGAPVCVDDIFHSADPGSFDGEGPVLMDWLRRNDVPWFTCAKAKNPSALNAIHGKKTSLGLVPRIRRGDANTSVFFEMPGARAATGT